MSKTLNQLNQISQLSGEDLLFVRDTSASEGKRISFSDFRSSVGSGVAVKIAVIGDSLCTENALHETAWPSLLEKYINNSGGSCRVVNFAINSFSFNKANTLLTHGGKTARQALINEAPDVVLCAFGVVDVLANDEGRTLTQNQTSAAEFYNAVRAALPSAVLCHIQVTCHDRLYADLGALKNKDVIPYFFKLRSTGILANAYSSEILDDAVAATTQTRFNEGETFHAYINNLSATDHLLEMDYWRIARIGLMGIDGLHPQALGKVLQCGYVVKELIAKQVHPEFAKLADKAYETWEDPDALFQTMLLTPSWDFDYSGPNSIEHATRLNSLYREVAPDSWHLPYKTSVTISRSTIGAGQPFQAMFLNGPPAQTVYPSVDGGAFDTGNPTVQLDIHGNAGIATIAPIAAGTYVFRYKLGPEVHGPFTLVFEAGDGGSGTIGTVPITEGGTGATTASGARANLGTDDAANLLSGTLNELRLPTVSVAKGGTGATTASAARTALGTNDAGNITTGTFSYFRLPTVPVSRGGTGSTSTSGARSSLGLTLDGPFTPSLQSGWSSAGISYVSPAYSRDHNGRVYLQGAVQGGTGSIVFTLPFGYRPPRGVGFIVPSSGQPMATLVNSDGTVTMPDYLFGSSNVAFLDGVTFLT